MPEVRFPLSGDVSQAINPWNWFLRADDSQFGFINVNMGQSSDPELETQILREVGSYGKQLGRIGDAMRVLMKHVDPAKLSGPEKDVLAECLHQLDEIDKRKAIRANGPGRR